MTRHEVKAWAGEFQALASGQQRATLRKNDRDYRRGDELLVRLWIPTTRTFDGKALLARVLHLCRYAGDLELWGANDPYAPPKRLIRVVSLSVEVLEVGDYSALKDTTMLLTRDSILEPQQRVGRS